MKYHVTIDAEYWPRHVSGWNDMMPANRSHAVTEHCTRISNFLNEQVPIGSVRLLVTDSTVIIDPLHGEVHVKCLDDIESEQLPGRAVDGGSFTV